MRQENEALIRSLYEAFSKGDVMNILGAISDDITWHASGQSPISGHYTGKMEVIGLFAKMMDLYDGSLKVQVLDVLANDDHVAVITNESGSHKGQPVQFTAVHLWTIRNAKCVNFVSYVDDACRQFWADASVSR